MSIRTATWNRQFGTPKESFLSRLLDPIDMLSEAVFSVLIVLIYTVAFGAVMLGGNPSEQLPDAFMSDLVIGAATATLAWGLIDGIMYTLLSHFARGEQNRLVLQLQEAGSDDEGVQIVADEFDYILEPISGERQRLLLYQDILDNLRKIQTKPAGLACEDFAGGLGSVLVAVIAVLPSFAPLIILRSNPALAIRASILVSFAVLFVIGFQWGRYTGSRQWGAGMLLSGVAVVLVLIAILLGGK